MSSVAGALTDVHLEDAPPRLAMHPRKCSTTRPLLPSNLVTIARTAFVPGQAQRLAPSIVESLDTGLSLADVTERLHLLWSMRRDVATQVREVILLGQVRQEPPAVILNELLDLTKLYTRDTY